MFSFLKIEKPKTLQFPRAFAYLIIDENKKVVAANDEFVDLIQPIIKKKLSPSLMVGKQVKEIFDKEYNNTIIGAFMRNKKPVDGKFLIGHQLYNVFVKEIEESSSIYYEFFYFPVQFKREEIRSENQIFQRVALEAARQKGFVNIDWIRTLPDQHCQQLIYCLNKNDHHTTPNQYCPFRSKCGFNPLTGWLQLDRRCFYRTKVHIPGVVYLKSLEDCIVPSELTQKKILVNALDLSLGGMKLQLPICLPIGSTIEMVFEQFSCEGNVRWTRKMKESWLAGVRFLPLDSQQHNDIIKSITKNRLVLRSIR